MRVAAALLAAMVVLSGVQWSFRLPAPGVGKGGVMVSPSDLLLLAAAVAAAVAAARGRLSARRLVPSWRMCVPVAAAAVSWVFSGGGGAGLKEMVQLVEVLVVGVALTGAVLEDGYERWLAPAVAAASVLTVTAGLVERFMEPGVPFLWRGFLDNRNHLGGFLALALPFLAGEYILPAAPRPVVWRVASVFAFAGGTLLAPNVVVAAAVAGGVVTAFAGGGKRGLVPAWKNTVVMLLLAAAAVAGGGLPSARDGFALYRKDGMRYRPSARTARLQAVLVAFDENPVTGFGPGRFQERIGGYYRYGITKPEGFTDDVSGFDLRADEPGTQGHWEVTLAETGLVGVWAWIVVMAGAAAAAWKRGRPQVAAAILSAAAAGLSVAVWTRGVTALWALMFALSERDRKLSGPPGEGG